MTKKEWPYITALREQLATLNPSLDSSFIESVYLELPDLFVELDADPIMFGPKCLNGKIAGSRKQLDRLEQIFLQTSHDLHRFVKAHRTAETAWELAKKFLFTNDPDTRSGRSVSDREAVAAMKLNDFVRKQYELAATMEDLRALLFVIKAKRADLRDTQGRLRDQIKLCQEEIALGGAWGSQVPRAPDINPSGIDPEIDRLDEILGEIEGEIRLPVLDDLLETSEEFAAEENPEADSGGSEIGEPFEEFPLNGLVCSVCGEPQRDTPHGSSCKNGHGGAVGVDESTYEIKAKALEGHVVELASEPDVEPLLEPDPVPALPSDDQLLEGTSSFDEVEAFLKSAPDLESKDTITEAQLDSLLGLFDDD